MQRIYLFLKGMAMGAADVVPGVSGGTIAFITGIYQPLIDSIHAVTARGWPTLRQEGVAAAWRTINGPFLLVLLSGIIVSVLSLAQGISHLLDTQPILVWSFFFGLIVASAYVIGRSVESWNAGSITALLLGGALAFYITVAAPAQTSEAAWFVFLSGSLAICAMILPGISGSFILLLLGKYQYIIASITEFRLSVIALFGAGCVVGLLSFARLLSWMFRHYRNLTVALLTGFMIGSLNKVWPWKKTLTTTVDRHGETIPLTQQSVLPQDYPAGDPQGIWALVAALAGLTVILILAGRERTKPNEA